MQRRWLRLALIAAFFGCNVVVVNGAKEALGSGVGWIILLGLQCSLAVFFSLVSIACAIDAAAILIADAVRSSVKDKV